VKESAKEFTQRLAKKLAKRKAAASSGR